MWRWIAIGVAVVALTAAGIGYWAGQSGRTASTQRGEQVGGRAEQRSETPQDIDDALNRPVGRLDGLDVKKQSDGQSVSWAFDGQQWQANGTPPECNEPISFKTPVDVSQATSILYPGQTRGGNYKPHGGFRFNNSTDNAMTVTVPMDAAIVNGARYLVGGETQYTFDFIASCGIMYRLGHLLELTPKFQAIANEFPAAKENDSRTTFVEPPVTVVTDEEIATAIGIREGTNTFVDWGVYDLRQKNSASQDASWTTQHADDQMLAPYAVCWFDLLPAADAATVKSLPPGDPGSGTTSDYCK